MTYPTGWDLVNITGTYVGRNGVPCVGSVTLSSPQLVLRSGTIVPAADIVFTLDVNGSFTGQIPATDDPNANPSGWVYTVTENVPGGRQGYLISAPHTSPGIDLSTVIPIGMPMPPTFGFPYVTLSQLAGTAVGDGAWLIGYQSSSSGSTPSTVQAELDKYYHQQWEAYYPVSWGWPYNSIRLNLPTSNVGNTVVSSEAEMIMTRYVNATSDRTGCIEATSNRTAGVASTNIYNTYYVTDNTAASGFDICSVDLALAAHLQGNTVGASWLISMSPSSAAGSGQTWTSGITYGQEINFGNRWSDFGLMRDYTAGRWVGGTLYTPDVVAGPDGLPVGAEYPATYGVLFVPTGPTGKRQIWNPVYIAENAMPAGGVGVMVWGSSTSAAAPLSAVEMDGYLEFGIDGRRATFTGPATAWPSNSIHMDGTNTMMKAYAPPTTGAWVQGDIRWNPIPAVSGSSGSQYVTIGWMCVASGSPGTWVDMRCLTGT